MKKVFILILNFNSAKDTIACLKSLAKCRKTSYKPQAVVVDNGSLDNSVVVIHQEFPKIIILENDKNLGFAAGNNVGIKYALKNGADWIVILNNDTTVPQNFLELVENGADIVGSVIKFKRDGQWIYDYGGQVNWLIGRPKHFELLHYTPEPKPYSLSYLSGCCLAIKRQVFERIGFFDENFFLYFEDVDFCLRAQKAGFKIALVPKVVIGHKLGGTIGRKSQANIFHNLKSNFIFINKYLGWRRPIGYFYLALLSIKILIGRFSK